MNVGREHQLNIAKKSMDYHCIGTVFLGLSHARAIEIIKKATGKTVELPIDCNCQYLHSHVEMVHITE
jgi:hypothetical protein